MSDTDSFIDEVSEEVRRDRLFQAFRRYGWIAVVLVVAIVGGAAWNEWQKAQRVATAQATGDALLAALEVDDAAARVALLGEVLEALDGSPETGLPVLFLKAEALVETGDNRAAAMVLDEIAGNGDYPQIYRDIALFKRLLLDAKEERPAERRADLETLAVPGNPLRLLAEEQLALVDVESGDSQGAILRLQMIVSDQEVTAGLRNRASQLIVALGGSPDAG